MAPQDRTIPERVAALEAERPFILQKLEEIAADVKVVRSKQEQQKGMARIGALCLNLASGVAGALAGIHWGR